MDPITLGAIGLGTDLLGGLISGFGSAKNSKDERKFQEQQLQKQRDWKVQDRAAYENKYKPSVPFYQSRNMPSFDKVLAKAVLGNLGQYLGGNLSKWGIDLGTITGGLNFGDEQGGASPAPMRPMPRPGGGPQFPGGGGGYPMGASFMANRFGLNQGSPGMPQPMDFLRQRA